MTPRPRFHSSTLPWLSLAAAIALGGGCSRNAPPPQETAAIAALDRKPRVFTVNYPLAYFAERLAGDRVDIVFPMDTDGDPAFWRPKPETILRYQEADLILLNGANYAKWVATASLPESRLHNTSAAFANEYILDETAITHSHGPEGEHSHAGLAFTTWLDPLLAVQHADAVHEALLPLLPDESEALQTNRSSLTEDLQSMHREMEALFRKAAGKRFIASHPVYQYLHKRYSLDLASLHWEPDETPSAAEWDAFDALSQMSPGGVVMLWEDAPTAETAAALQARKVPYAVFRPYARRSEDKDYLSVARDNIANLAAAIEASTP